MSEYNCNICGSYISPEHGGHECSNCGVYSCCDDECTPEEFVTGHSTSIPYCKRCKDVDPESTLCHYCRKESHHQDDCGFFVIKGKFPACEICYTDKGGSTCER